MTSRPAPAIVPVDSFSLATNRGATTLLHQGRRVGTVPADRIDAQFRLPDGGSLVLASDNTAYQEHLAVVYLDAGLRIRDTALVGGAYTPGTLSYAHPTGPASVVFCFHDLEHEVTIGRRATWFRRRWLTLREPEHVNIR